MNKLKLLRIASQTAAFIFVAVSFFILSYPFKFIKTKEFFLASPSLAGFAAIAPPYVLAFFMVPAAFVLLALPVGRVFCGWLCPYGAAMAFFAFLITPFRKYKDKEPSRTLMSTYLVLSPFAFLSVLGFPLV